MTETELVNVALKLREQVDFLWHFYVSCVAILIGWLFSTSLQWTQAKHRVTLSLFLIFAFINLSSIYSEYGLLESALMQLGNVASGGVFVNNLAGSNGLGSGLSIAVHLVADIIIIQLINLRYRQVKPI